MYCTNRAWESDVDMTRTHQWLQSASFKAETEGFIRVAQKLSILTLIYQGNITHDKIDRKCIISNDKLYSIDVIFACYSVLAPTKYKIRHNRVGEYMRFNVCCFYEIPHFNN